MINIRKFLKGLQIIPKTPLTADTQGELEVNSVDGKLNYHNGTVESPVVTESSTATLTNKSLSDSTTAIVDVSDSTKQIKFDAAGTTGTSTTLLSSQTANRIITLPDATTTLVGSDSSQTISNKTIDNTNTITVKDANFTIQDDGDTTKQAKFQASGISTATTRTYTLPDANTTLVGTDATQTLTNKTLTSPVITNATLSIDDTDSANSLSIASTSTLTTGRTLTLDVDDGNRTLEISANIVLDGSEVKGPASATDNAVARFDLTTGKLIQNSGVIISDANGISGLTQLDVDNLRLDGNTLSSTDTNGNVVLDANGTGQISLEDVERIKTQASSPATPAAGYTALYPKTDGFLYYKNESGAETKIQAGSGGINYILNPDFEGGTTGWAAYSNTAGVIPVTGTGGSPNITFTATSSSPLRGLKSGLITKDAANRQGQGVSYDFTIDPADKNKQLAISFDYSASANYTGSAGSEYMVLYVYDITNSVQIPASNINIPFGSGTQSVTFNSTTSTSYRIEFHIAGTGTSAWTFELDNVMVGPQTVILAPAMSDWVSYTPTFNAGFGTVTTIAIQYRRDGPDLLIRGSFRCGTTTTGTPTMTLPTGLNVLSTILVNGQFRNNFGFYTKSSANADIFATSKGAGIITDNYGNSNSTDRVLFGARSSASDDNINDNTSTIFSSNEYVFFDEVRIPISNWSSNIQLNNSRVEYASNSGMGNVDDTTSFINDPNGNLIPIVSYTADRSKTVRFINPIQASDTLVFQVKPNNSQNVWIDLENTYQDAGSTNNINPYGNATGFGLGIFSVVNSTDVIVRFGQFCNSGSTNWSASDTSRWRVVKYSGAVPVDISAPRGEVFVSGGSGYGSSNTKVRRFTTQNENIGSAVTYAASSTLGDTFTINEPGIYAISYQDTSSTTMIFGITVNWSASLSTFTNNQSYANGCRQSTCIGTATVQTSLSWTGILNAGDVVRAMSDAGGTAGTQNYEVMFSISQVSK